MSNDTSQTTDEQGEDAAIVEMIGDGCCGGGVGPIPYPLCECPRAKTTILTCVAVWFGLRDVHLEIVE